MLTTIASIQKYLSEDFLGGPRILKLSWVINFQKGGTLPFVLTLMYWFDRYTIEAWTYLALHGSYGICWLIKDFHFPDKRWNTRITLGGAVMSFLLVLGWYWVFPLLVLHPGFHPGDQGWSPLLLGTCILVHTIGVGLLMASDAQKYFSLKYHPGLIRDGLFKKTRNPNYLGEMMIYGAYALLAQHWLAWIILLWVWIGYFTINMLIKDRSLSRYPDWLDYKKQTGILLPKIFPHV